MTSRYRHRRTSNPATAFPNPIEPGEIAVNSANRQIVLGDVASGVAGVPLPLLALRFYDVRAIYAAGDMVYQANVVYRAKAACGPESFNPAHWDILAGALDPNYVQKAGDTMTGPLLLPAANPTLPVHAAHKAYVDAGLAGKSTVLASTTAPDITTVPDNTLWYETDSGTFFIAYNDGDSRQWVIASPQPDPSVFVTKAGDTMTGYLVLNADPITPLGAATGQYAIAVAAAAANTRVAKTGDVMTGPLENPTVPTLNQHVTNKLYVDGAVNAKSSTIIADSPPPGAPDGTIWYESDSGLTYVRYNDGNSSQWVALLSTAGNALLYDAQTLTTTQQAQARKNIFAAPFDALAFNGMQVNGSCEISQERAATSFLIPNGTAVLAQDGWKVSANSSSQFYCYPAYTVAGYYPVGLSTCCLLQGITGGAMAAGNWAYIQTMIEGYRVSRMGWGAAGAWPITIGFFVYSTNTTGMMAVTFMNGAGNRTYTVDVAVTAINVWQYKTITVPGDVTGTWDKINGVGLRILFCFGAGSSNNLQTPNVWSATNGFASPNTTNFYTVNTAWVAVTGLVVLPGIEAPSAERAPLIMRPYDQELTVCTRYYETGIAPYSYRSMPPGVTYGYDSIRYRVRKRATPTLAFGTDWQYYSGGSLAPMTPTFQTGDVNMFGWVNAVPLTNFNGWFSGSWAADARLV